MTGLHGERSFVGRMEARRGLTGIAHQHPATPGVDSHEFRHAIRIPASQGLRQSNFGSDILGGGFEEKCTFICGNAA